MNNKKIQLSILTIFLAATLVSSVAAFGVSSVYAGEKKDNDHKEKKHSKKGSSNSAEQEIEQVQANNQNSQCVAAGSTSPNGNGHYNGNNGNSHYNGNNGNGYDKGNGSDSDDFSGIIASCNNVGLQFQNNDGNLALGQQ